MALREIKVIAEWRRGDTSGKTVSLIRDLARSEPNNYTVIINDNNLPMEEVQDKLYLIGATNFFNAAVQMMEKAED